MSLWVVVLELKHPKTWIADNMKFRVERLFKFTVVGLIFISPSTASGRGSCLEPISIKIYESDI